MSISERLSETLQLFKTLPMESGLKDQVLQAMESIHEDSLAKEGEQEKREAQKDAKITKLEQQLAWFRRQFFGKKSEKHLPEDPRQLSLCDDQLMSDEERAQVEKEAEEASKTVTRTITVKVKPSRRSLDTTSLPVRENHIYPEGVLDEDGKLKDEFVEIGTEESSRLERVPAEVYVSKTIRHKIVRRASSKAQELSDESEVMIAPLPLAPVAKCMAGATVLADILIGKFMYHLPFHRLIQQYRESGILISDSTMGGWHELAVESLKKIYERLISKILASEYIQVDETTVPVIDNEKHRARKGYMWSLRDGISGDVMFHYDMGSRAQKVALALLGKYHGALQCDGYEVYQVFEKMGNVTLYGCWAHARRYFHDALSEDEKLATEALVLIRKLYKVESDAKEAGLTADKLRERRQKLSYPVIKLFEKWLLDNSGKVREGSLMAKAIRYAYTLLPRLSRYVNDGRIFIDNNGIELMNRSIATGRKNWMFCGNNASACRAAIVYSLVATCKASDVDPREWMVDVLEKLPYYRQNNMDIDELLPRNWAKKRSGNKES